ncbi:MAG: M48 family metalloprotease [Desulfobacterales bacterium]|nr:M48 family metalloprotease [Desulfobacterales bacterium]
MFNNIIYFIVVLLIFNISTPKGPPEDSFVYSMGLLLLASLAYAAYCRWEFQRLLRRVKESGDHDGASAGEYHWLVLRLSVLGIFLFALDVYLFHLKYWLLLIPGFGFFSVMQGIVGIMVFISYLMMIWTFSYPAYQIIFQTRIGRRSYILSNLKLNMPTLFPWIILSFLYDLIPLTPWSGSDGFLNKPGGQLLFFSSFLILLMIFMPLLIQTWWGCKPLGPSEKAKTLKDFLHNKGFRFRNLLSWPIFEGRMMTAGIMGIVPRFRYILVTDALMETLSIEELKAVMAHEMGHAKYRHMFFYILFFLGFMVLSYGLFDIFFYYLATHPFFREILSSGESGDSDLFSLFLAVPILITMFVYFRYVMGFFMRHFERQADLYSAVAMGSPGETISALEKIGFLSGKIRDLPSWHHFSIRERVDTLLLTLKGPEIVRRHTRFVAVSFAAFLVIMTGLGYLFNFSPVKENIIYRLMGRALHQELLDDPDNPLLYQNMGMVYLRTGNYQEAIRAYEKLLSLDENRAIALNNLAWILVTSPDEALRDKERALILAKRAVVLERSAMFLDTLAEAFYANGLTRQAVEAEEEAISLAKDNVRYYQEQLDRFRGKGQ